MMSGPHRFYIRNLPSTITKEELESFLVSSVSSKQTFHVTVETIGQTKTPKQQSRTCFALVSTDAASLSYARVTYQGRSLTIQKAFGAWSKPKQPRPQRKPKQQQQQHESSTVAQQETTLFAEADSTAAVANESDTFNVTQSLDALLADYGEYDPNWQKQQQVAVDDDEPQANHDTTANHRNCLGMFGKAPMHVVFYTFGMIHGIPHTNQDAYYDVRETSSSCPPHLAFLDGQTNAVKRVLATTEVKSIAYEMAKDIASLLIDMQHNHGYANPRQVCVLLASDTGRHRSVVVAELAATALRKLLRKNVQDGFQCPVSVGCYHRDIQKRRNTAKNEENDEDEIRARRLPQRAVRW